MKAPRALMQIVAVASSIALAGTYVAYRAARAPATDNAGPGALATGDLTIVADSADTSPSELMSGSKSMVVRFPQGRVGEGQTKVEAAAVSQPADAQQTRKPAAPRPREVMSSSKFAAIIDPIPSAPASQPASQPAGGPSPKPPPTTSAPSQPPAPDTDSHDAK